MDLLRNVLKKYVLKQMIIIILEDVVAKDMKKTIIKIIYHISCFIHKNLSASIVYILDTKKLQFVVYIGMIFIALAVLTDVIFEDIIEKIEEKEKVQKQRKAESPWWKLKEFGGWI